MSQALTLNITGRPGTTVADISPWLRLSQPDLDESAGLATISSLVGMHNQALAGRPAQQAMPACPGLEEMDDGSLQWSTEIHVHTSSPDLGYSLGASNGELGDMEPRRTSRECSYTFPGDDHIDLGVMPAPGWRYEWESPAYDDTGRAIPLPRIWSRGSTLYADRPVFGVIRLFFEEVYQAWPLTITAQDQEDPFACTISAFWGDSRVEQLEVAVADCAVERAKSFCRQQSATLPPDDQEPDPEPRLHVEYDVCTGDVVRTYYD